MLAMPAALAALLQSDALAQIAASSSQAPGCTISGIATAAPSLEPVRGPRAVLPGVVVSLKTADDQPADISSSALDGAYSLNVPGTGQYKLTAELVAFALFTRDVTIDAASCHQRVDVVLTLVSRVPAAPAPPAGANGSQSRGAGALVPGQAARPQAGRGQNGRGQQPQQFQSLSLLADQAGLARPDEAANANESIAQALLPPGFSPETSSESVTTFGSTQGSESFFGPNGPGERLEQMREAFGGGDPSGLAGAFQGGGGRGGGRDGGPGGRGGDGGFGGFGGPGGFGRGGRGNQVRGAVSQNFDTSHLDSGPFALNGQPAPKPQYFQERLTATLGGPLAIPHLFNAGPRTFFFVNYTGNHSRNPYDQYSNVPTEAQRAGDLSSLAATIVDPATHQPFPGNQIPAAQLNPAAQKLLDLIPLPNNTGPTQNFHAISTTTSHVDDINLRLVHSFGAQPQRGRGGAGARGGGGGAGRGGGRGSNLNVSVHYRHSDNTNANLFPALGGSSRSSAWDTSVGYSLTAMGVNHSLRFGLSRQHSETTNLFAFNQDIAGDAGLLGVAADPFDWGAPNVSFSSFTSLRDTSPSSRTDQTFSIGDSMVKTRGRHTLRFGADYRHIGADSRTDSNARGSFVFTGLYTGLDFADFLLGFPQQATLQFGPGSERFRQRTWDLFLQDDWRASAKVTVNAGLRYEYFSPVSEADNRLATLDVAPDFTAAVPVIAGNAGPYSGALPDTVVRPFRAGFAPRIGVARKARPSTTVRTGYGINYSSGVYQTIAQQLAGQPPFASTAQMLATALTPVRFESALQTVVPGLTTNTFAVDPNYRLGYVQIWNVDVQRDFVRTLSTGISYVGTRGANLDILRAPNRGPTGLRIAGVQPFIWESSGARSIMHSMSLRVRKRMTRGIAAGLSYTLAKSIDDASSIGGGGGIVAQNDQDLAAERGLSSFDQRHRVSGDFSLELPFGDGKPWFNSGTMAALLGNWVLNGNVTLASGTPFTARVLSNAGDVSRGTNGTLRANYNGDPIQIGDPTTTLFFNKAAFSIPAPGTFGNAGRNTIVGPGTSNMNMSLTRNLSFGQNRGMSIQIQASNLFNTVQFSSIDTVVNSRTFGQVTGVRQMRRIQVSTRFRF